MPHRSLRTSVASTAFIAVIASILLTSACSSSTDSPGPRLTHPAGIIDSIDAGVVSANGIAITRTGLTILTRVALSDAVVGHAGELTFGPGISGLPLALDAAITPDGSRAFVTLFGNSRVAIVDMRTGTRSDDHATDIKTASSPLRALVTPDGNRVYITSEGSDGEVSDTSANVYAFDAHSLALLDTVIIQGRANGIAYDRSTNRLYVSSGRASAVYEIDATTDTVLRKFPVGDTPEDIAISEGGALLWVATEGDAGVQVIDLATGVMTGSVPGTSRAFGLALSPDGRQLYATRRHDGDCIIIDEQSRTILTTLITGGSPQRVVFDATGGHAYITDEIYGLIRVR